MYLCPTQGMFHSSLGSVAQGSGVKRGPQHGLYFGQLTDGLIASHSTFNTYVVEEECSHPSFPKGLQCVISVPLHPPTAHLNIMGGLRLKYTFTYVLSIHSALTTCLRAVM